MTRYETGLSMKSIRSGYKNTPPLSGAAGKRKIEEKHFQFHRTLQNHSPALKK
jgi:hypothetical protein